RAAQAGAELHERRLAAAARAHDGDELVLLHRERHVLDGIAGDIVVREIDMLDLDEGCAHSSSIGLPFARIARQTRSGVAGSSMCSMPSASQIALMTVASAGVVPPSPPPRRPSGWLAAGTSLSSVMKNGSMSARGSA